MLDWLRQYHAIRVTTGLLILFVVACVQSCSELKHVLWGIRTTAEVTGIAPSDRGDEHRFVTFAMNDENGRPIRFKRTIRITNRVIATGSKVEVEHLPREAANARLVGQGSLIRPGVLAAIVAAGALWMYVQWRDIDAGRR